MTEIETEQALEMQEIGNLTEEEEMFIENLLFTDRVLKGDDKIKFIDLIERIVGYGRD